MGFSFSDFIRDPVRVVTAGFTGGLSEAGNLLVDSPGAPAVPGQSPIESEEDTRARDEKMRDQQLRLLLGGRSSTFGAGALGDTNPATVTTRSLLGG